jgi:uracil phosphoribosyltransferase
MLYKIIIKEKTGFWMRIHDFTIYTDLIFRSPKKKDIFDFINYKKIPICILPTKYLQNIMFQRVARRIPLQQHVRASLSTQRKHAATTTVATTTSKSKSSYIAGAAAVAAITSFTLFNSERAYLSPASKTPMEILQERIQILEKMLREKQEYKNYVVKAAPGFKNVEVIDSPAVRMLFTVIRNKDTENPKFVRYADRLMTLLAEEGLARVAIEMTTIQTPCGYYDGIKGPNPEDMCVVSIPRSGDILMEAVRRVSVGISVGKILCQRDESDPLKRAKLFYCKLPKNITEKKVLLVDPMLATGGSASLAIKELVKAGVSPSNIIFLNVVSCPAGLKRLEKEWPHVQVITAAIDPTLNSDKFIVPGLGDFGDRYYRTE